MSKLRILKAPEIMSLFACIIVAVSTVMASNIAGKTNYIPSFMEGYYIGKATGKADEAYSKKQVSQESYEILKKANEDKDSEEALKGYFEVICESCGNQIGVDRQIASKNEKAFIQGYVIGYSRQEVEKLLFTGKINTMEYSEFCGKESRFLRNPTERKSQEFIEVVFSILGENEN